MSNRRIVGDPAADLAGSEVRDGYLRMWLRLRGIRQWAIPLPLVRTLLVIVEQVPSQGALQATPVDAPAAADTLALQRANPALGKGIQVAFSMAIRMIIYWTSSHVGGSPGRAFWMPSFPFSISRSHWRMVSALATVAISAKRFQPTTAGARGELLSPAVSEAQRLVRGQKPPAFGIEFIATSCILLFGFPGRR